MSEVKRLNIGARWSEATIHNGTLYVSGLVAPDQTQDLEGQAKQVFAQVDATLAKHGSDKSKILFCQLYLADITQIGTMNAVWDAWISRESPPCRATVQALLARPNMLIEVVVTAAV